MKRFLNVSNHALTNDQEEELKEKEFEIIELPENIKRSWGEITPENLLYVVKDVFDFVKESSINVAMVAGQNAACNLLISQLDTGVCESVFSYSKRIVTEEAVLETGKVIKRSEFKHEGFYFYPTSESKELRKL